MSKLIVGNWKMNGSLPSTKELVSGIGAGVPIGFWDAGGRVVVCPPFPYLSTAQEAAQGTQVQVGSQNVHPAESGAFTGEVSTQMLNDLGISTCIIGHSERRHIMGEQDAFIREKLEALLKAGISPILCVGETLDQRESESQEKVVGDQLRKALENIGDPGNLAVAYEPVWAIGTGKTASPEQAAEMHHFIRSFLKDIAGETPLSQAPILYGGSVSGKNAKELMQQPDIDGVLVGGASLKSESFLSIIEQVTV